MFRREEVEKILAQARRMDPLLEMFGVADHQYRLASPVDLAFVRTIEEKISFPVSGGLRPVHYGSR